MFWEVFEISMLSILKSSGIIKRNEKVLVETGILMTGTIMPFFGAKTI